MRHLGEDIFLYCEREEKENEREREKEIEEAGRCNILFEILENYRCNFINVLWHFLSVLTISTMIPLTMTNAPYPEINPHREISFVKYRIGASVVYKVLAQSR